MPFKPGGAKPPNSGRKRKIDGLELRIEYRPLGWLKPYERNARKNDKAVARMVASIREYGFTVPILAKPDGEIVAGHTRQRAATELRMDRVPVIIRDNWTEGQVKAFRLLENRSQTWADWDFDALALEFGELKSLNLDLTLTGFDSREIDGLLKFSAANASEDDAPPLPSDPITRPGDLWVMGDHRLLCGDSTKPEDVARVMDGRKAGLMNTDPPYGVDYVSEAESSSGKRSKYKNIANDELKAENFQAFLEATIRAALPHFTKNPAIYLWHPMLTQGAFAAAAADADVLIHRQIVWVKPSLIMGRGDYHWRHELCFYGWIQGNRPDWLQGRDQDTVWSLGRENDGIHPTQKPVELFRRPILNHLSGGAVCYEPFGGSGSQFAAAELTGRICFGLEIDPGYCDVIVQRWEKLTGRKAERVTA